MLVNMFSYQILGSIVSPVYYSMSWKDWGIVFLLIVLAISVLYALSNIVVKAYPSLTKKTQLSDVHYQAAYNQKYVKGTSLIHKLRQLSLWKVIALVLVLMFVFIRYFTLAFNDVDFWW